MNSKHIFNNHSELIGKHALFSPSQSAWLRYEDEQIVDKISSQYRAPLGTEIHEFAAYQIELGHKVGSIRNLIRDIENHIYVKYTYISNYKTITDFGRTLIREIHKLPPGVFDAVKFYINDAIGFNMTPEQPLVYSDNVFGTADTISFKDNFLRIHDLKTGSTAVHKEQLETYAALFCLEYKYKPATIGMEMRIYQIDNCIEWQPTVEDILPKMDQIIRIDKIANNI